MYRHAVLLFRHFWQVVLTFAILLWLVEVWSAGGGGGSSAGVSSVIAVAFLAYYFHAALLNGYPKGWTADKQFYKTALRVFLAFLIPIAVLFVVALSLAFLMRPVVQRGEDPAALVSVLVLFGGMPMVGLVMSVMGTMIPAAVAEKGTGLWAALKRAPKTLWFILWRLLAGPAVFFVGLLGGLFVLEDLGYLPPETTSFADMTLLNAVFEIALWAANFFYTALLAAILSMAYMRAEGGDIRTPHDGRGDLEPAQA